MNIDIERFIETGYAKVENAFSPRLADECRAILWRDTGCDPHDPTTWTKPLVRLGMYGQEPFQAAANSPALHSAFDQLVGRGRWRPRYDLGTFAVRFPAGDPGDAGWHVDGSYGKGSNYHQWRVNVSSKGRALLMLFLFSDVGPDDAPTRIRSGSHLDIARRLKPAGPKGVTLSTLFAHGFAECSHRPEVAATGNAGTVYLCHPFLLHAPQPHRGTRPRFLAQPPLVPARPFSLKRSDESYSAVELAIRRAL